MVRQSSQAYGDNRVKRGTTVWGIIPTLEVLREPVRKLAHGDLKDLFDLVLVCESDAVCDFFEAERTASDIPGL